MADETVDLNEELLGCARYGELEDLQAIISEGANIDHVDGSGNSSLHYAAGNGHTEVVQVLLVRGAVFRPNESGNTPLHWAALNGHAAIVGLLLDRVADIQPLAKNAFGRSALTEALGHGHEDIGRLILSHHSVGESAASHGTGSVMAQEASSGRHVVDVEETEEDIAEEDKDILTAPSAIDEGARNAGSSAAFAPV